MLTDKIILLINLRLSERHFTEYGVRLDKLIGLSNAAKDEVIQRLSHCATAKYSIDNEAGSAKFTTIMRRQCNAVFGDICLKFSSVTSKIWIDLKIEGINQHAFVENTFAYFSSSDKAAGVEGDDLVFCIVLSAAECEDRLNMIELVKRPQSYRDALDFVKRCSPALAGAGLESRKFEGIPGFYVLNDGKWRDDYDSHTSGNRDAAYFDSSDSNFILSLLCAYLFYCWLICQRAERLINQISFADDEDIEVRKFILTRKKIVACMRYALLKNRAEPDSLALPVFFSVAKSFRLEEQLMNLSRLSEEVQKTIELQGGYLNGIRLKKIEWILFIFAILSLGVGLNAIQMPPFYDSQTTNALSRQIFWIVFLLVVASATLLWGSLRNWKRTFKVLRNIGQSVARRLVKK